MGIRLPRRNRLEYSEAMFDYKPHSFDTHAFFFALKCFACVLVLLTGVKYGTAAASEHLVRADAIVAAAGVSVETTQEEALAPLPKPEPKITLSEKPLPKVSAQAFVIADLHTGEVYGEKDGDSALPIASLSKLLVALVAREMLPDTSRVTITNDDRKETDGTPGSILRNDVFIAGDLYYPLLMESNNSVAYAFARAAGEGFIARMNTMAEKAGMEAASFDDASGISPHNVASARDLFALAKHIRETEPGLFDISRQKSKTIEAESGRSYTFVNFNVFTDNSHFVGGKTGYTDEARQTMLALFDVPLGEASTTVAIIVLHSSDRKGDVEKLLHWFTSAAQTE